ncbi:MAG: isocitrate lyase/PEP mutase family protein [Thermodesulfobacteriota bacterium]
MNETKIQEKRRTAILRELLREEKILLMPGCFNACSARLIEQAGFKAIYISGAAVAGNFIGYPDIGLATMTEVLENARNIVQVTTLPIICDADTGFGNPINMMRTVREFEAAGVAGIQIEDQVMPKKCGHTEGKMLISKAEMIQKIKAAVDARLDPDFLLVVRTDAIAVTGLEEAIERAQAYQEAGGDIIFVEAPRTIEEMRKITEAVKGCHLANMVEGGGKTPILSLDELSDLGYKVVIYPVSTWMASIKAMQEVLKILKEEGTTSRFTSRMVSFQEMFEVVGRSKFIELEKKYAV